MAGSGRAVVGGLVFEQRHDGVRPIGDIVERLLIADRPEAGCQTVQLLFGQHSSGVRCRGVAEAAHVRLRLSDPGEPDDPLVVTDDVGELFQELVDPFAPRWRQRGDRSRQILAVMIAPWHVFGG